MCVNLKWTKSEYFKCVSQKIPLVRDDNKQKKRTGVSPIVTKLTKIDSSQKIPTSGYCVGRHK